ncbi:hypothetical protein ABFA07_005352 [Porites harrisoni]
MEDLKSICEAEQNSFCVELLKRLNLQRNQNYLCDITLVAKEGNEFRAHKNVLSAASPFFVKLLQSEMREKDEGVIRFEDISGLILADVLEFIYTGSVEVNETNAKNLIIAAEYLLIEGLKTKSGRFLEQQITCSNCISTFRFAEKYRCEELVANSTKFILDNFASVAESEEFLDQKAEEVEKWISNDEIRLAAEEDVVRIILNWIEHDKSERKDKFKKLFGQVRLVLLSRDSLLTVVTHELVREDFECLTKVLDAIDVVRTASEDINGQSPRKRLETQAIVVGGAEYLLCYLPMLPEKDDWKTMTYLTKEQQKISHGTKMINFHDQLYTINGYQFQRYDPVFRIWTTLRLDILYGTGYAGVCRGQIYVINIDSNETSGRTSTVKNFDVESNSWQTVHSSNWGCRYDSCIVAAGNCLYVLGGGTTRSYSNQEYVTVSERFDIIGHQWEKIADMQQERAYAFGVAFEGKIFVAGGKDRSRKELNSCEVYNITTDEWQFIGNLNVPRSHGSMLCVNGTIYVLGGSRPRYANAYTVEVYDPVGNKWTQKTTIPVERIPEKERSSFTGCAMKLSKGVLDKIE